MLKMRLRIMPTAAEFEVQVRYSLEGSQKVDL